MDALATIAVEIQATFTGILVIALILILQILDLRGANQKHERNLLEVSRHAKTGENKPAFSPKKYRLISAFSIFLQFVFGIIVFAVFICWSLYLFSADFKISAVFSLLTALIGISMPFVVWVSNSRKCKEMANLLKEIKNRPDLSPDSETTSEIHIPEPETQTRQIAPDSSVTIGSAEQAAPPSKPLPVSSSAPVKPAFSSPDWLPEDSMLRRHYLTHLQAEKRPYVPSRPTDSMLRRHYDSMLATQQPTINAQVPPISTEQNKPMTATPLKAPAASSKILSIPEDSMLRRHFLSLLRSRIEADLPAQPTDSILRRHFESWKNIFIEGEILKLHNSR